MWAIDSKCLTYVVWPQGSISLPLLQAEEYLLASVSQEFYSNLILQEGSAVIG